MAKYISKRVLLLLITILVIAFFTIILPELSPYGMLPLPIMM